MGNGEIVLFETSNKEIKLSVLIEQETIWLTMAQLVKLFERDISVISRHINSIFNEEEVDTDCAHTCRYPRSQICQPACQNASARYRGQTGKRRILLQGGTVHPDQGPEPGHDPF